MAFSHATFPTLSLKIRAVVFLPQPKGIENTNGEQNSLQKFFNKDSIIIYKLINSLDTYEAITMYHYSHSVMAYGLEWKINEPL